MEPTYATGRMKAGENASVIEKRLARETRIGIGNSAAANKRISPLSWNAIELNLGIKPKKQIRGQNSQEQILHGSQPNITLTSQSGSVELNGFILYRDYVFFSLRTKG